MKRITLLANILVIAMLALSACAQPTPQVVEKEVVVEKPVVETVVVEREKVVEKPVVQTVVVEKEKVVEKVVTPMPPSKKGGTFVTSIPGDPASLNGIIGNDGPSLSVICLNQLPLTLGGENWGDTIAGELAESWEVSGDGKEWIFYLRKGVKWQDGQPFTADDVLFTFQALQNPDVQAAGFRERFMEEGEPIPFEKVDDYTIKATLKKPIAPFVINITVPIIPKHVLEGQDINTSPFNQKPIGTGPFKVVEWRSGETVTLEANPDFYRGEPYLDRWVVRILPSIEANVIALQAGEIDFGEIPGKDVPKFLNPDFTVFTQPRDLCDIVLLNNARPFFQDKRVKQALMHGLDRQALLDTALQGYGTVADSPFNPPVFVYQEGDLPPYEFDLDKARELLKEAGWEDTDGDGIVDKDGEPFEISLGVFTVAAIHQRIVPLVQAWWQDIGIGVTIKNVDVASFYEAVSKLDIEKPFDAQLTNWGLFGPEPDQYAASRYAPERQELSQMNFYNEEIKALFDKGRVTFDLEERKKIYEEAERKLWEELPVLPLFYRQTIYVVNNRVNIDEAELDSSRLPPFRYPEKIYIQEK